MSKIRCQQCRKKFPIPEGFDGTEILCPHCGAENVVTSADAGEIVLIDPKLQRKKRLKIAAIVTSVCVALGVAFGFVLPALGGKGGSIASLVFELRSTGSESYYTVKGLEGDGTKVVIPSTYQGKPVKSIERQAFQRTNITEVVIPDSVTSIGDEAFQWCSSLTSVVIGDGVEEICKNTFFGCEKLSKVELGSRVTCIGEAAFMWCESLPNIQLPESLVTIETSVFSRCSSLTSIAIPDSVTSIGSGAFFGCSSLTAFAVEQGNAFYQSLDGNLYNKEGTLLIQYAIGNPRSSFVIPDDIIEIGENAFAECVPLTRIVIPESVTTIGNSAFTYCTSIEGVIIPDSVTTLDYGAFSHCSSLADVTIGNGIAEIGMFAFSGCERLQSVIVPDSVMAIGSGTFAECTRLESITLSNQLTSIVDSVFRTCLNLTSITIPETVSHIDDSAFSDCYKLVEILNRSPSIQVKKGGSYYGNLGVRALVVYNSDEPTATTSLSKEDGFVVCSLNEENILVNYTGEDRDITVSSQIDKINAYAFYGCEDLTSVAVLGEVTEIGEKAFWKCKNLYSLTLGEKLESVADDACEECYCLVEVINHSPHIECRKGDSIAYYALTVSNGADSLTGTKLSNDNGYMIYTDGQEKILVGYIGTQTQLTVPSYVTKINAYAFYEREDLVGITIGENVTSIGSSAFRDCSSLQYTVKDGLRYLGNANNRYMYLAGTETTNITTAKIEDGCKFVGSYAFESCDSLTSVVIPNSVTSIGECAFQDCNNLTSVVIPNSVTSIGDRAFENCHSLTSIEISGSVTSIGDGAFYGCSGLTSVVIPDSVTSIGARAFEGAALNYNIKGELKYLGNEENPYLYLIGVSSQDITTASIESDCKVIAGGAFRRSNLTWIEIPDGVTSIGEYAFYDCSSLTSVYYGGTESEWENVSLSDGNDPLTNATVYYSETQPTEGVSYTVVDGEAQVVGYSGTDAYVHITNLYEGVPVTSIGSEAFLNCSNVESVVIPDGVTSIGGSAFSGCTGLVGIVIPDSVTSIGDCAFSNCGSLTSVVIPEGVTSIGREAFIGCSSLTSIEIPDSVESIGESAFGSCSNLTSVVLGDSVMSIGVSGFKGCSSLTSIEIPNSVTSIGASAFIGCSSLTSLIIPNSVTSIGGSAFYNCSSLADVYYSGSESEWANVSIGSSNDPLTAATVYYYSETQPTESGNYWHYVDGVPTKWE